MTAKAAKRKGGRAATKRKRAAGRSKSGAGSRKSRKTAGGDSRILAIDIGGTGLKAALVDEAGTMLSERVRIETPYPCPPPVMIEALLELVKPLERYGRVAVGFPGVVREDRVLTAPHFGNREWENFPLAHVLSQELGGIPVRAINDAEMQGLAAIEGRGLELVLTLGTGAGTALFRDGELMPHMELAHHPLHKSKTYNEYIGNEALKKAGAKRWNKHVARTLEVLRNLLNYDYLYIGGGNAEEITFDLPDNTRRIPNEAGLRGGGPLWRQPQRYKTGA